MSEPAPILTHGVGAAIVADLEALLRTGEIAALFVAHCGDA
ncbi:MAG TPA: hypothetical protein VF348_05385 [Usitatibacter sp.]